jgi:hypothetical protein
MAPRDIRHNLALGPYLPEGGQKIVEVGLTPMQLPESIPEEFRETLLKAQKVQHDQIAKLTKIVGQQELEKYHRENPDLSRHVPPAV